MRVYANLFDGSTIAIPATLFAPVRSLEASIAEKAALKLGSFSLSVAGRKLSADQSLLNSGIADSTTIDVSASLNGGKKKKKKSKSNPKKGKHKKRKVKQHILQMYRIEKDGSITRTRRKCMNDTCYPTTFMARHADRHACGKCGTSMPLDDDK
ncbi:ubiquitin-40S ribosomal protein S27a [Bonamia ostreae]|uniref:Ubiquitin-40S ribosomal protein S27a n=1 Tax=Bonamia ostreae TaxID=126728 RepID=A0ABV2AK10_9EUKA